MELLGMEPGRRVDATIEAHDFRVISYTGPRLNFCITSPRTAYRDEEIHRRKPGALHHLAFRAPSREEVDRLHRELERIGARIVSPPRLYPEYTPDYYAVFFKDLDGIKYEIVHYVLPPGDHR
jgi:catechol 2,3-dioxygenase-like lactoylglutathione lyase family enzyme